MADDPKPAKIWLVKGAAGPARYVHFSLVSAETEARRLAVENPGRGFYVMESVAAYRCEGMRRVDLRHDDDGIPF